MLRTIQYSITEESCGQTVGVYLRRAGVTYGLIKHIKTSGDGILLNGSPAYTNRLLAAGDMRQINLRDTELSGVVPADLPFRTVYEDEDFLVADKPAGMATHPSRAHPYDTLANAVAYLFAQRGEHFVFRAVNRLDLETSGLILIAKNILAASLGGQTAQTHLKRLYLAVTDGEFPYETHTFRDPIRRETEEMPRRIVSPDGAAAVTHCKRLRTCLGHSLLLLRLETGRTHQIRVHLSHAGFPICGDRLYGGGGMYTRLALHSCHLSFLHPVTGKEMRFVSTLPECMKSLLNQPII